MAFIELLLMQKNFMFLSIQERSGLHNMPEVCMKKNYVLDTNVLIHDPNSIFKFEDNDVIVPFAVLEEIDGLKKAPGETGYNAREAIRIMLKLRENGDIRSGVKINENAMFSIYSPVQQKATSTLFDDSNPNWWFEDKMDNKILLSVLSLSQDDNCSDKNTILVTNDINMLIKADCLGIAAQEYKNDRLPNGEKFYTGRREIYVNDDVFSMLSKGVNLEIVAPVNKDQIAITDLTENEFIVVKNWQGGSRLAKVEKGNLVPLFIEKKKMFPCDISPRNTGQTFLLEALMSDKPLTICNGPAGTGKTLLAVASGLEQSMNSAKYKNVLVCRPNVMMDEEIGFLPGTEQDKISPLMRGVYDNLGIIFGDKEDSMQLAKDKIDELFERKYIYAESIAYLRGRSIPNTYIIIDECQNATPNQILSIVTRASEGSKIVLLGDVNQIDNIRLDSRNNGLVYAIERMKGSDICEITSFYESECTRSRLAKEAAERMKK